MKSEQEIRERLEQLKDDPRLTEYDNADVRTNTPLALHQASGGRAIRVLEWVLDE